MIIYMVVLWLLCGTVTVTLMVKHEINYRRSIDFSVMEIIWLLIICTFGTFSLLVYSWSKIVRFLRKTKLKIKIARYVHSQKTNT